jgi:O-antigen/teichoic acid export membrane protein
MLVGMTEVPGPVSVRHRLMSGGLWAIGGRLAIALTALLSNALLARILTPSDFGVYFLALSVVLTGATVGTLGLNQSVVRFVAESMGMNLPGRARRVVGLVFRMGIMGAVAVGGAYLLVGPVIARSLFHAPALAAVSGLVAGWIVVLTLQTLQAETFRGFHDIKSATTFGGLVAGSLLTSCLLMLWLFGGRTGLSTVLVVTVACGLTSVTLGGLLLRSRVSSLPVGGVESRVRAAEIATVAWPIMIAGIALAALIQADVWIVGAFRSQEEVAIYRAASQLALMTILVTQVLYAVLPPLIVEKYTRGESESLQRLLRASATVTTVVVAPVLGAFVLMPGSILNLVYGEYYRSGGWVLALISLGWFVNVATGMRGMVLLLTGHERTQLMITLVAGSFNVILCGIGAVYWNIYGVAVGAMTAMIVQCLAELVFVRRRLGIWTHASVASVSEIKKLTGAARAKLR